MLLLILQWKLRLVLGVLWTLRVVRGRVLGRVLGWLCVEGRVQL